MRRWAIVAVVALSACTQPFDASCISLSEHVVGPAAGCEAEATNLVLVNRCEHDVTVSALTSRSRQLESGASLPLQLKREAMIPFSVRSDDGGTTSHALDFDFSDGTRATKVVNIEAPAREYRKIRFELQPAIEVIVASDGAFSNAEIESNFGAVIQLVRGEPFYRFHFVGPSSVRFVDSADPSFEMKMHDAFSRLEAVPSPSDAIDANLEQFEQRVASRTTLLLFGNGRDVPRRPIAETLARFKPVYEYWATASLFVRGASCPAELSAGYDASTAVHDACNGSFEVALTGIQPNDVVQRTRWYFDGSEFRPSMIVRYDDERTNAWWVQSSPNGDYWELWPGSYERRRFYSVEYDLLTACER